MGQNNLSKNPQKNSSTNLDDFYELLKERGKLEIPEIAKIFNIDEELAMDWCKILESGDLATIDSPRFGTPTIELKGKLEEPPEISQSQESEIIEKDPNKKEIQKENKKKIKQAEDFISELRKRGYDNKFIKKLFRDKGWPDIVTDNLLSK